MNVDLDPDLVAARLAFADFQSARTASPAVVAPLVAAMTGSSADARSCAAAWLVEIARTSRRVATAVVNGFDGWAEPARLAVMQGIHCTDDLPERLVVGVVRRALGDANTLTRRLAGVQVQYRELRSLLPALAKAAAVDPDPDTAASLARNVAYLRDGYIARPLPRKRYEVNVAIGRRGVQRIELSAKTADGIGFPEIARRVRARSELTGRQSTEKPWDPI